MNRFASLRFERLLDDRERANATRVVGSRDARVLSWATSPDATYAYLALTPETSAQALGDATGARADEPPLALLRFTTADERTFEALRAALTGAGRPAGILAAASAAGALDVAVDPAVTALSLLLAIADAAIGPRATRTVDALLPLDDASLAELAAFALGEPDLSAARVVEAYLA